MREIGARLEYTDPQNAINRLYLRHKDEFDNDCTHVSVSDTPASVNAPPTRERVFTLDGLILLCMFSEQPKAKTFRHWLRKIGKQVMVEGYVAGPGMEKVLEAAMTPCRRQIRDTEKSPASLTTRSNDYHHHRKISAIREAPHRTACLPIRLHRTAMSQSCLRVPVLRCAGMNGKRSQRDKYRTT